MSPTTTTPTDPLSDLTEDRLLGGRIVFHQPRTGYRAAIDPIFLAAAVPARSGERVLELGIGTGAAALCLGTRVPGTRITGIDRDRAAVRIAGHNIVHNRMQGSVEAIIGDIAGPPPPRLLPGAYDHVMANPPYLPEERSDRSPDPRRAAANVESEAALPTWVAFAAAMLRPKGTLTIIQRADRVGELLALLQERLGGLVVFPLWPRADRPASRIIVQGRKGIAAPLTVVPGLVLHGTQDKYTATAEAVLRDSAPLPLLP